MRQNLLRRLLEIQKYQLKEALKELFKEGLGKKVKIDDASSFSYGGFFEKQFWPRVRKNFLRRQAVYKVLDNKVLKHLEIIFSGIKREEFLSDPGGYLNEAFNKINEQLKAVS